SLACTQTESEDTIMSSFTTRVSLAVIGVLVTACGSLSDGSTAPLIAPADRAVASLQPNGNGAERTVYEAVYDLTGSQTSIECDDGRSSELVALDGKVYERIVEVTLPSGALRTVFQTMPVGLRGTGVESGEEYRVTERDFGSYHQSLMGLSG